MEEKSLTTEQYIEALEKMKKSPRDRLGILGELGATGLGGAAGAGLAGAAATSAGVATIFGSSTLGSVLGGIFVTSTPVGWVAGSVALGGALGYGISKVVSGGGKSDAIKQMNIRELQDKIKNLQRQAHGEKKDNNKVKRVIEGVQLLIENEKISQDDATRLLAGIQNGSTSVDFVFDAVNEMLESERSPDSEESENP